MSNSFIEYSGLKFPNNVEHGQQVVVHDPSIFLDDDGTYYAFGTHYAISSSKDLINWKQIANGPEVHFKKTLNEMKAFYGSQFDYVQTTDQWAPSVRKLNGKYYMYYCLSRFGTTVSVIGRVESDNVLGPYINPIELLRSPLESVNVNALDPEIYYDRENRLWMVYGSFFAGIYIHELHNSGPDFGLLKNPNTPGKKLWQGGEGPEGPNIVVTDEYYYLICSLGFLGTNYNMRVLRSKNIDGPYLDQLNRESTNNLDVGVKLAGNYHFKDTKVGHAAFGHNSVIQVGDKYLNVYHSRFQMGETDAVSKDHQQRVSQLFLNSENWFVLSPHLYAGEYLQKVSENVLVGEYELIIQNKSSDTKLDDLIEFIYSQTYNFLENGKIFKDGNEVGSYKVQKDYYIELELNSITYRGIVVPSYSEDLNKPVLSISSVSKYGISLWGYKNI
jgi:arabinan endo-1,5-alpha-L-arabinosidase